MKHVIRASFNYAVAIRNAFGITTPRRDVPLPSRAECFDGLRAAMAYTEETLEGHWEMTDDEIVAVKIDSAWGVKYDLEQMLEHAIVHILRHRRQIERFLTEPKFQG
jgi:uncharacterized damage-inducible protein DinB